MLVDSAKRSQEKGYHRVLMLRDVLSMCSEDEQEEVSSLSVG